MQKKSQEINAFILQNIRKHPADIVKLTSEQFGMTRQAASRHMKSLIKNGQVSSEGKTRSRTYALLPVFKNAWAWPTAKFSEDKAWLDFLKPNFGNLPPNIYNICQYGFTEMFNNVIDHSESSLVNVELSIYPDQVDMKVVDNGVGIFNKIKKYLGLDDPIQAILELSKGKLSTDPVHHTGEGIFFSSRMFDKFTIVSDRLVFFHSKDRGFDVMLEDKESFPGTVVSMSISVASTTTAEKIFNEFSIPGSYGFDKTIIPVILGIYSDDNLISRSQARRLLARVNRFKVVILDFENIELIGQSFADEIFRVFRNENPAVNLAHINANEAVSAMISRALSANQNE